MNSDIRHGLRRLDRALLDLLDERARLLRSGTDPLAADAGRTDLLRRYRGCLSAEVVREWFAAVDRACDAPQDTGPTAATGRPAAQGPSGGGAAS